MVQVNDQNISFFRMYRRKKENWCWSIRKLYKIEATNYPTQQLYVTPQIH